ncbi:coiled-coil domain-containing protein 162 [Labrus mixtus]|uniref:coiled-coil domain-containing protein 162 n=1 Tax=Labrus mixtus TaxID=508554 RepID=UPI0029C0013C|nr:coiled-coil domain-containing protein 162 [Labrus mixtus]
MMQGQEKQAYAVETFSKLLELVTIRHRLLESASETANLAQLYRNVASELGFDEFHLYLRPLQFEVAEQKHKTEQSPVFITAILEDDSCVDRFIPSHLPLSIQELDENQIGRFSFSSEESVTHLLNRHSLENLQVTLACQVTQKNALMSAVKLVCLCHWAESETSPAESERVDVLSDKNVKFDSKPGSNMKNSSPSKGSGRSPATLKKRLMEAFVSIQLEKCGLRDEMLNSFMEKKRATGGLIKTPEEAAKIKRRLIIDFLNKFSKQISQYCVRAQIVAYYSSLSSVLEDVPSVRQSHFMIGQASDPGDPCSDPRTSQCQQQLLSADGKTLQNLWFVPHFSEVLHMFKTLHVTACAAALHHTLQLASALHDIMYYLVSFSRLGNIDESFSCRRGEEAAGSLSADWGGAEGIGAELQELQHQVSCLSDPSSPQSVSRVLQLRRNVLLLQFDTAVRHLIREIFLSSGDVASYQSVNDNMVTALSLLSNSIQSHLISLTLPVPPPLQTPGCQAQKMYPWRSFLACHGLFPLHVCDVPPIEYCMQLCLSGLSDRSRLQANAAILGVSLLLEDVLNSGREAGPVRLRGNKEDLLHNGKREEEDKLCTETEEEEEEEEKASVSESPPLLQDPIRVQSVLRGFLLLMKQLQVFKESWARTHLGVQVFTMPSLYQQFVKLYRAEIFYPSMRALARHMGKEQDYEVLLSGSQSLLPPPGASEVDVKTWQLHKLLESTECDMIRAVQRRISRETTLVISERTRHDTRLPTDLWKTSSVKYSFSSERPQMVETFIQQLMEGAEEAEGKLRVSQDRLQQSLTQLSCSVVERERRSFLLHSQFYEQILRRETQLLYHTEQDLKHLQTSQSSSSQKEVSDECRGLMLEVSALQAQVAHLEEEKRAQEERLSLKFRERYEPLVRHLCSTCIQLQGRLDEQRLQMKLDVSEMVSRIRGEGADRMIKLKKKYGCTKDNDGLKLTKSQKEEVDELQQENRRLSVLICKLKTLSRWRKLVDQEKLHRQLLQAQQREITSRCEALRVKMTAEEEVVLLQEELEAARRELSRSQTECSRTKNLLDRKTEELRVARHQSAQEARGRQELDSYRVQSLEQMKADVEDRERQLRALSEQLDRGSRMNQIHRQRSAKEIQQVRGKLQQERSFKQEAFQQVDRLQNQVNDMGAALSRSTSSTGQSRTYYTLSVSRLSATSPSAGLHRAAQQSALQLGSLTDDATLQDLAAEQRQQRGETAGSRSHARIERPKAGPTRLRVLTAETSVPDL